LISSSCTQIHLKFLARSRVLLGFATLIVLGTAIGLVPALFLETTSNRFDVLKSVAEQLHGTAALITGGIGLLAIWSHRRQRSLKIVASKPSPLEGWVASIFAAAAMAGIAAHAAVAAATFGLSLYWGVPYESGFVYLAAMRFVESLILLAVLSALSSALHPVIAALIVMFFSESTFRFLGTFVAGATEAGRRSLGMRLSLKLLRALYYIAPAYAPFEHKTALVHESLRVAAVDWKYLAATCGYTLLASAVGFLVTVVVLRRRPLI
jgi:ABC-type transport system involved in multi-copper enzyme maturation permease subunit